MSRSQYRNVWLSFGDLYERKANFLIVCKYRNGWKSKRTRLVDGRMDIGRYFAWGVKDPNEHVRLRFHVPIPWRGLNQGLELPEASKWADSPIEERPIRITSLLVDCCGEPGNLYKWMSQCCTC